MLDASIDVIRVEEPCPSCQRAVRDWATGDIRSPDSPGIFVLGSQFGFRTTKGTKIGSAARPTQFVGNAVCRRCSSNLRATFPVVEGVLQRSTSTVVAVPATSVPAGDARKELVSNLILFATEWLKDPRCQT